MTDNMNTDDKVQHIDNQFIFEAGSINTIIKAETINGDIYSNSSKKKNEESTTQESVEQVLNDLLEAKDEETGKPLMVDKTQWYAVYRVLMEYCNYPKKLTDFCSQMAEFEFDRVTPPCNYTNVKKVPVNLPNLSAKVELWGQFKEISESYSKQHCVAKYLLQKLGFGE